MFGSVICICLLLRQVYCGPDLCANGAIIDSITWVSNLDMWFFTSGGHYWYIKSTDIPVKVQGKPLPGGFKKGEAAYYWDSLDVCASANTNGIKAEGQEIYVIEKIGDQNQFLVFNTKNGEWIDEGRPMPFYINKGLSQANVDWSSHIDATFIYQKTKLVVFQNLSYSVVDIIKLCTFEFGTGRPPQKIQDFRAIHPISAMAALPDIANGRQYYLFQDNLYFTVTLTSFRESEGKFETTKEVQMPVNHFFKLNDSCRPDKTQTNEIPVTEPSTQEVNANDTMGTVGTVSSEAHSQDTDAPPKESSKDEENGFPWIIVIIVVIVIVLIAIVLIVCLAMRKGKGKGAESSAPDLSRGVSNAGPSMVASKASASQMGSQVNGSSKMDGKSGSKAMYSNFENSPSTMSVRSSIGSNTTNIQSKAQKKKK